MSENTCILVSSRGIAKSCDDFPAYSSPQPPTVICGSLITGKPTKGPVVYLRANTVPKFVHFHIHRLSAPVVIVIGDDDDLLPYDQPNIDILLSNPFVKAVWAQNYVQPGFHPKIRHLPIGLDYHTISFAYENHAWGESGLTPQEQEKRLFRARDSLPPISKAAARCVANFHHCMSMPWRAAYRIPALQALQDKPFVTFLPYVDRDQSWALIADAAFVIAPPGNGPDTHRTWETLVLGRIPIVQRTGIEAVYDGLPILLVNSYEEVTQDLLDRTFADYAKRWTTFAWHRVRLDWWVQQIRESQK
jgi:hypothetical protein